MEGDVLVNQMSRAARRSRDGDGNLFDGFTFYLPPPYFRSSKLVTKGSFASVFVSVRYELLIFCCDEEISKWQDFLFSLLEFYGARVFYLLNYINCNAEFWRFCCREVVCIKFFLF